MSFDPLDPDYLLSVDKTEENLSLIIKPKPEKARSKKEPTVKFHMSKELRERLTALKNRQPEENLITAICDRMLKLTRVPQSCINYLGLSNDDFSKISYLNPERIERLRGQKFTEKYIVPGTQVIVHEKREHELVHEDGTKEVIENRFHTIIPFSRDFFTERKEIKLVRSKVFDAETNTQHVVYSIPSSVETINRRHYNFKFQNKVLVTTWGFSTIDKWYFRRLREVTKDSYWDYNLRYHQSIHKILTNLFKDEYSERDKNIFAEQYFKLVVANNKNVQFLIGDGDLFREAYYEANYKKPSNNATLWQSCMRYSYCQDYFELYEELPEVKIAVLYEYNEVVARCLLWEIDGVKYYDRIYYYNDEFFALMENYLENYGYKFMRTSHSAGVNNKYNLRVKLTYSEFLDFGAFPYVDTMRYYYPDLSILTCEERDYTPGYELSDTSGSYENNYDRDPEYTCPHCDREADPDDAVLIDRGPGRGTDSCPSCVEYSEEYQEYILSSAAAFCEFSNSYVLDEEVVELVDGETCYQENLDLRQYENDYGYFVLGHYEYEQADGKYYHPSDPMAPFNLVDAIEEAEEAEDTEDTEEVPNLSPPLL